MTDKKISKRNKSVSTRRKKTKKVVRKGEANLYQNRYSSNSKKRLAFNRQVEAIINKKEEEPPKVNVFIREDINQVYGNDFSADSLSINGVEDKIDEFSNSNDSDSNKFFHYQARELNWEQFFEFNNNDLRDKRGRSLVNIEGAGFYNNGLNLDFLNKKGKTKKFFATLPRDFFIFYKNLFWGIIDLIIDSFETLTNFIIDKVFLFGEMCQWILESFGRAPLKIGWALLLGILFLLSIIEKIIIPIFNLFSRCLEFFLSGAANYYYALRKIDYFLWRNFISGLKTIIDLPKNILIFLKPHPPIGWARTIASFVLVCVIIIAPFKGYTYIVKFRAAQGIVLGAAASAYEQLQQAEQATSAFDFGRASEAFKKANQNFDSANKELNNLNILITAVLKAVPQGASAKKLLEAGQLIAEAGEGLTIGLDFLITKKDKAFKLEASAETAMAKSDIAKKLQFLKESLDKSYPKILNAEDILSEVSIATIPEANQENFNQIKSKVSGLEAVMRRMRSFIYVSSEIIGASGSRRYLVIFQNEAELRPTGGFIGSFALIDVSGGVIKKMEIPGGGPYDLKGALLKRVAPPKPLQKLNELWQFQDANWFPDFSTSAKKLIWFYENSGGSSVDGVIALNSDFVSNLLEITGPIEMLDYDKVIDAANFQMETQLAVEIEYDKEKNKPKQFIADLTPKLLNRLLSASTEEALQVFALLDKALNEKDLLFYFTGEEMQEEVTKENWGGEIKSVGINDDYLAVVNANIGGGKTDNVIEQKIFHEAEISPQDGKIIDTVTIIRTHKGSKDDIFSDEENFNYIRFYVPQGSVLLGASGFTPLGPGHFREMDKSIEEDEDLKAVEGQVLVDELSGMRITNEFGKTVFGNWIVLSPGEIAVCKIKYRLPFKFNIYSDENNQESKGIFDKLFEKLSPTYTASVYTLLLQKQPGSKDDILESTLIFPKDLEVTWYYPLSDMISRYENNIKFKASFSGDKYYGVILRGE